MFAKFCDKCECHDFCLEEGCKLEELNEETFDNGKDISDVTELSELTENANYNLKLYDEYNTGED